jgi:hypothetical protein
MLPAVSSSICFVGGALHGVGHLVSVEDGAAFEVAGGAADGLDERALGAEEDDEPWGHRLGA